MYNDGKVELCINFSSELGHSPKIPLCLSTDKPLAIFASQLNTVILSIKMSNVTHSHSLVKILTWNSYYNGHITPIIRPT